MPCFEGNKYELPVAGSRQETTGSLMDSLRTAFIGFRLASVRLRGVSEEIQLHVPNKYRDPRMLLRVPGARPFVELSNERYIHIISESSVHKDLSKADPLPGAVVVKLIFDGTTVLLISNVYR